MLGGGGCLAFCVGVVLFSGAPVVARHAAYPGVTGPYPLAPYPLAPYPLGILGLMMGDPSAGPRVSRRAEYSLVPKPVVGPGGK